MKRKILTVVLSLMCALLCAFGFVACGVKTDGGEPGNPPGSDSGDSTDGGDSSNTENEEHTHTFENYVCTICGEYSDDVPLTQGLEYEYNYDNDSYELKGIGSAESETVIYIPKIHNEKPVTSIGDYAFCGCTKLSSITFVGTKAQWQNIDKDSGWNNSTGDYTIICTDGTIAK